MRDQRFCQASRSGKISHMTPQPLVSIIIRCSERDKLALTLASIAQQEYPNIEVIIVGMTGGQAPEMPDLTWGRTLMLRTVATDSPISRPLRCGGQASA